MNRRGKLADAAEGLAAELERGAFPLKRLARGVVFFDAGQAGCAIGHVLARAGCRGALAPFRGTTFDGSQGERWWDGLAAVAHVLGVPGHLPPGLRDALDLLQVANDTPGDDRRGRVARELREVARELRG